MAVLNIERYMQKDGKDVLKVILKPTQRFPEGAYFYADAIDEELVRNYTWYLMNQRHPYVVAVMGDCYSQQRLYFHQEKANNILNYYPDYINHINMMEFDDVNANLDKVTNQQNCWARPTKGYQIHGRSFQPYVNADSRHICAKCVRTEVEAIQSAYQLEVDHEDYMYSFLKDRRKDLDILDLERTGQISEEEAIYRHVLRYASDNAWYVYRYNLFDYFKENNIPVPVFSADINGFMCHSVTGQRLCPM